MDLVDPSARSRRDEHGYVLIEVVVGALLLVLISLGIYAGFDGASRQSGRNRDRSVAAALAQQDQERMRTMSVAGLAAYATTPYSRSVTAGGQTYTVTSNVGYANDTDSPASCTSAAPAASYLKISSTVTGPADGNGPVTVASLVSPRAGQGGTAVQVVGDGGVGVPGVPVTLDQNAALSGTTDANGCVQFGFLDDATDYSFSINANGYVDPSGNQALTAKPLTVTPGSASITSVTYDKAGAVQASFVDSNGNPVVGMGATLMNNGVPLTNNERPLALTAGTSPTSAYTLFPFTSSYAAWAGACHAAMPPTANQASVKVVGGQVAPVRLTLPTLKVTVQSQTTTGSGRNQRTTTAPLSGADVRVTDACGSQYPALPATDGNGKTSGSFPYGQGIQVCADDNRGSSSRRDTETAAITSSSGASVTLTIDSSSTPGRSC
ncbi:MAG TPA: hypothetical protein VHB30_01565 [Solirubrobacteraceae bacterium]|nr:hypothetical protein [Solirubrobacteraceae bacterium]